jgi:hypothetical protein
MMQNDSYHDNLRKNITDEQIDFLRDCLTNIFSEEMGPSIQAHFGVDELEEMWMIFKLMVDDKQETHHTNNIPPCWNDGSLGGPDTGWEL